MNEEPRIATETPESAAAEILAPAADVVAIAAAEAIAALELPDVLPMRDRVRWAIERVLTRTYHHAYRGEVVDKIRECSRLAMDALRRGHDREVPPLIERLLREAFIVACKDAPQPPSQREVWGDRIRRAQFVAGGGRPVNYVDDELQSLWRMIEPNEHIVAFDVLGVKTNTRIISREELRIGNAPAYLVKLPGWDRQTYLNRFQPALPTSAELTAQRRLEEQKMAAPSQIARAFEG